MLAESSDCNTDGRGVTRGSTARCHERLQRLCSGRDNALEPFWDLPKVDALEPFRDASHAHEIKSVRRAWPVVLHVPTILLLTRAPGNLT